MLSGAGGLLSRCTLTRGSHRTIDPLCLENPRPAGAEPTLTENVASPFQAEPRQFSLPDVAASVILTGRVPNIIDAFRLEASGTLPTLSPVKLRGIIEVDPRKEDFFKVVIEQRKGIATRTDLADDEKERLGKFLKVLANSTSYGIYAEMNREETNGRVAVQCHGIDEKPYQCRVTNPEKPGDYCFPPLASLITGAARLMLALLEKCVADLDGTYAMEDTDSMAIVSTKDGGLVPCPVGPHLLRNGSRAIRALSWQQVDAISQRFELLNPYDQNIVRSSILKIEDDNFDTETNKRRQLWCIAISAKRYALFLRDRKGTSTIIKYSEHGLGHLLNPTDTNGEDREWIKHVWQKIVRHSLTLPAADLPFERIPAVGRVTVSSPTMMLALHRLNDQKNYSEKIKPFNFLLSCHVSPLGHPVGADPFRFHLISPYDSNPNNWLKQKWIDQYSGKEYFISTTGNYSSRQTARVKTYGELIAEYQFHPEAKCADADWRPATKQTVGLL